MYYELQVTKFSTFNKKPNFRRDFKFQIENGNAGGCAGMLVCWYAGICTDRAEVVLRYSRQWTGLVHYFKKTIFLFERCICSVILANDLAPKSQASIKWSKGVHILEGLPLPLKLPRAPQIPKFIEASGSASGSGESRLNPILFILSSTIWSSISEPNGASEPLCAWRP